jgi:hypothetical protein
MFLWFLLVKFFYLYGWLFACPNLSLNLSPNLAILNSLYRGCGSFIAKRLKSDLRNSVHSLSVVFFRTSFSYPTSGGTWGWS